MSWKRSAINGLVRVAAAISPRVGPRGAAPSSIFVLRNNDLGDLLVVTPLFEALRNTFPQVRLVAGVGRWTLPVLENNPYLDAVLEVNAPWHNKFIPRQDLCAIGRYLIGNAEIKSIRQERFDLGIDILGSPWGALLLLRGGIPRRVSMANYAGGEPGSQEHVHYNEREHVSRSALRFAELLGAQSLPPARPQIFLRPAEIEAAEALWTSNLPPAEPHRASAGSRPRLLLGPGTGLAAKGWPEEHWRELLRALDAAKKWNLLLVGGEHDREKCARLAAGLGVTNLAGALTLRQTFALAATTDRVVCHSSMLWHAAAAWKKPAIVVLGAGFPSAAAHRAQWGYPESAVLGREPGKADGATVLEVLNLLRTEPARSVEAA